MEEDIKILEEYLKPRLNAKTHLGYEVVRYPELEAIDNLIKEFKKLKIENIEYKLGQLQDTAEDYKVLKKELEKWKNGEM